MHPALLIRLRPRGPWRVGPGDGGTSESVDALFRSDRLFSAVTLAMKSLGRLDEWLDVTVRSSTPAVVFGSLFPYQGDTLFVPPPQTVWPPPASLVTSPSPAFFTKTRWDLARFVPLPLVEAIMTGQPILADQWIPDPDSGCLLRRDRPSSSPFRTVIRTSGAVDRLTAGAVHLSSFACTEFETGSGLWTVARYAGQAEESAWDRHVRAAFQLLGDTGFGGRRKSGWGQTAAPEFTSGSWPAIVLPRAARLINGSNGENANRQYWLLSLYSPASSDSIDWNSGDYRLSIRTGHTETGSAPNTLKKSVRMVTEGSVIASSAEPTGAAADVAPDDFPHPVYRSGLALAVALPLPQAETDRHPVEIAPEEQGVEIVPCPAPAAAETREPDEISESPAPSEAPSETPAEQTFGPPDTPQSGDAQESEASPDSTAEKEPGHEI